MLIRRLLLAGFIFSLFSVTIWSVTQNDWFRLKEIVVEEMNSRDHFESEVTESAEFKDLGQKIRESVSEHFGQWLWRVSLNEVERLALQDIRVASVHVQRWFPNKIEIQLKRRKAILGLITQDGVLPISVDATLLNRIDVSEAYQFPILRGQIFRKSIESRKKVIALFEQIPREGLFSHAEISEIQYDKKEGYRFLLNRSQMQVLLLDEQVRQRSSRVEKVLRYLESQSIKGRVIDARLSKKVVVRLRNDS